MAKDRRSKEQKRKAKLTARTERRPEAEKLAYSGRKYQADAWVPAVYETELGIYETIILSRQRLTNKQVETALMELIHQLRDGLPPALPADAGNLAFTPGQEVEFLMANIRRHWGIFFEEQGTVQTSDLVGILRTLLYSIQAHAWNTGPDLGYVHFLKRFMEGKGVSLRADLGFLDV
jgi:hypothetical protein